MDSSQTFRQRARLIAFVVLVTAVLVWAVNQKGAVALPILLLYAAPHLLRGVWQYAARKYGLPQSSPDEAYLTQLRQWRRDRKRS